MKLSDLRTPSVLIDKTRLEQNIDRMQAAATARGIGLRPHAKTHKSPDLARVQIARGAVGICCAKLGEAEVFAAAGIEDIRLPYPLNPANADRVLELLDRTRLSFIVDDLDVARGWSGDAREPARGRRAGEGGRRLSSLRHRSRRAATRPSSSRASPSCRACASAGC